MNVLKTTHASKMKGVSTPWDLTDANHVLCAMLDMR